jgi:hypothetical protein
LWRLRAAVAGGKSMAWEVVEHAASAVLIGVDPINTDGISLEYVKRRHRGARRLQAKP